MNWQRVTKANPCAQCRKPDWCTVSLDGGWSCCMRTTSDRPARNGGWLHALGETSRFASKRPPIERPAINATRLWSQWREQTEFDWVKELANDLGLSAQSLESVGCVWASEHRAWAFPMRDGYGDITGIRLRNRQGRKWAVTGSRQGIFIPHMPHQATAYITEGPTDTAAALDLGLMAIGRPSCNGCSVQIVTALRHHHVSRAVIVSDNDGPGIQGAELLSKQLTIPNCVLVPPCKDLRQFLRLGGSASLLASLVSSLVWSCPHC